MSGGPKRYRLNRLLEFATNANTQRPTPDSESWICQQQVSPIQRQQGDNRAANKFPLARVYLRDAQARRAHDEGRKRVDIEQRKRAVTQERERVPLQRGQEVRMKKCHGRSSCAAGEAGTAGKRVKETNRPGQFQGQPTRRQHQAD